MITIASVGFVAAGVLFGIFALFFRELMHRRMNGALDAFSYAYVCLAVAMLIWGVAAGLNNQELLNASVFLGNVWLMAGTVCMVWAGIGGNNSTAKVGAALASVGSIIFLIWRLLMYPPEPQIVNGILLFNTAFPVTIVLGLVILLIWLPASLRVARIVTQEVKTRPLRTTISYVYGMATFAALIFMAARTPQVAALSFAGIVLCFGMLIGSAKMLEAMHGE